MTTTLPPCPLCGSEPVFCRDFWSCTNGACELGGPRDTRRGLAWLALCARLTPAGHVAVPESEIEALRDALPRPPEYPMQWAFNDPLPNAVRTIIARLPRKAEDHVETLVELLNYARRGIDYDQIRDRSKREVAALEAAINLMKRSNP